MQTIIVLLNPGMLENADLDLRYRIPDRIEEASNSLIQSNGYDYIDTEDGEPGALEAKSDNVPPLFRRYVFVGKEVKL